MGELEIGHAGGFTVKIGQTWRAVGAWIKWPRHSRSFAAGFTLIEVSISMLIMTLIITPALLSLSKVGENAQRSQTVTRLEEIREALEGFVLTNGRLPCPAVPSGSGTEDMTGADCNREVGVLPWADLTVGMEDPWGHLYSYHVASSGGVELWSDAIASNSIQIGTECTGVTAPTQSTFALCTNGNLQVQEGAGGVTLSQDAVAIVISHGRLGEGAFVRGGARIAVSPSADEAENSDDINDDGTQVGSPDRIYMKRDFSEGTGSEFDDLILLISPLQLKALMVNAGKLP